MGAGSSGHEGPARSWKGFTVEELAISVEVRHAVVPWYKLHQRECSRTMLLCGMSTTVAVQ
jgi:hypothetical protein